MPKKYVAKIRRCGECRWFNRKENGGRFCVLTEENISYEQAVEAEDVPTFCPLEDWEDTEG